MTSFMADRQGPERAHGFDRIDDRGAVIPEQRR
jgi:hypothetical protein